MSMRLNGASAADLEALGIDTTGMTQGKKSIVQQYKHMAGIDIMEGTNYKSTFQILDELHDKWASLNMAERQAIAEASGGKRAGSVFASLMTNWEDARKVVKMAENSTGSAMQEQAHYAESVQFSIDRLRASWQELAYNLLDSKALKGATEFLVNLLNALNEVTKATDGLIPVLAGLGAVGYTLMSLNGFVKTLGGLFKTLQTATEAKTEATVADTIANGQNAASELADAAAKDKTSQASAKLTGQQIAETNAQKADTALNSAQALSESVKRARKGQAIQYFGERPETPTLVREPKPLVSGKLGGALTALGFDTTSTASMAAAGAIGAFVAALAAVGVTAYATYQHNEKLKESALELANAYNTSKSEIDGYKEQISDLYKTINDSNTSYEDARAAREQLLGVQNALIEKYGTEAENVQLVTEAVNGQIEALDKLNEKSWQQTVNDFNKTQGTGFLDFWNHVWHGADDNIGVMQKEMFEANVKIGGFSFDDQQFLQDMQDAFGGEYEIDMNQGILTLSGDLSTIKEELYEIQNLSKGKEISEALSNSLTKQINSVENTLNKYQEMSNQWILNEDILPNYQEQYQQLIDAHKNYESVVLDGDEKATKRTKENFIEVLKGINTAVANDDNKDRILRYFRSMYPDLQAEVGKWQLKTDFFSKDDSIKQAVADVKEFSNEYELLNYKEGSGTAEQDAAWLRIDKAITDTNSSLEDYIALARESGKLTNFGYADSGVVGSQIGAKYQGKTGLNFAEANQSTMDEAINALGKDDFNDLMSMSDTAMAHIGERAQELAKEMGVTKLETQYWTYLIDSALKEFREIDNTLKDMEPPKFDMSSFAGAKEEMANIGTLYKSIKEQIEEDPTKVVVDIADIEKLREKWAEALGGDEAFDEFEQKLASSTTTVAEKIGILEDAATKFADSQFEMYGATEETAAMVKSQLTEMGYLESSVDEYVNARMRQAAVEREVNAAVDGNAAAVERARALLRQEGEELGYTGQELENYIALMMQANGMTITGDVSWLKTLREELKLTEKEIQYFLSISKGFASYGKDVGRYGANGMSTDVMQKASKNNARAYEVGRQLKFDKDSVAWGSKSKGGGGGGGGKSDAEKETDVLAELSKQLDEIQAAYSSLSDIVKSYNENGKLTIDQAQSLINTDFRYLAMLTDEGGQLRLNEQGMQDLAKAKLQEMQIRKVTF